VKFNKKVNKIVYLSFIKSNGVPRTIMKFQFTFLMDDVAPRKPNDATPHQQKPL
jgi:hypothetical protein